MSKFLAFAYPAQSAEEAKARIAALQKQYFDARHVCWAYMIGAARTEFMSNDNGEPSGTAGKPILGQINSAELTNIVIGVVRYFGGIKLGTSGLIAAYREAARAAIEAAVIVERRELTSISFSFPYGNMNSVMKIVKRSGWRITDQNFDNTCTMTVELPRDSAEAAKRDLGSLTGNKILY